MSTGDASSVQARLRDLPAVHELLRDPALQEAAAQLGRARLAALVREMLDEVRRRILAGENARVDVAGLVARAQQAARDSLRPVLNATGVVVHTNLGRAPLAPAALAAVTEVARGYSTLEYDLAAGGRGSRHHHAVPLLRELTGAEDAAVVNNNAGAVLLALSALAAGREVVVSRGELVEIGGGFRIPDVMQQSGARLREVGTTNRTHPRDYAAAIGEGTALLLKVHRSNFAVVGFTAEVELGELAALAHARGLPLMYDAGSGCLRTIPGLASEHSVQAALAAGADLVTFSGDKLLGGPQAGLLIGRAESIVAIRRHPLMRALRPDKLCLAALVATLRLWRDHPEQVPVLRAVQLPATVLQRRAEDLVGALRAACPGVSGRAAPCVDRVGGGASPLAELAGWALRLEVPDVDALSRRLREGEPPLIARIEDGALWLHPRTLEPDDDIRVVALLAAALSAG